MARSHLLVTWTRAGHRGDKPLQVNIHETTHRTNTHRQHSGSRHTTCVISVEVCVRCRHRDKGQRRLSNHAQGLQINTTLSLETNIGPSHLWTCSSTSLIQVHFFSCSTLPLSTYTYTTSSPHLHVSTETVSHRSTLCPYWNCGIWRKEKGCGNEHLHNNVSVWFVCSQCQPFTHSPGEDLWIIKGIVFGMLEEVSNSGLNYCSPNQLLLCTFGV